jgi:hypothetical protein
MVLDPEVETQPPHADTRFRMGQIIVSGFIAEVKHTEQMMFGVVAAESQHRIMGFQMGKFPGF